MTSDSMIIGRGQIMAKLNPIIGGAFPGRHPSPVAGTGTAVDGGFSRRKESGREKQADHRSKKGYAGSSAGLGRSKVSPTTVFRSGPKGPVGSFGHSVQLPNRGPVPSGAVSFTPASRPSLMTRIGRGLRRRLTGS
jgi:hypothetical protein